MGIPLIRRYPPGPYGVNYGNGETRIACTGFVFRTVRAARREAARVMAEGWDAATVPTDLPPACGFPMDTPIVGAEIDTEDDDAGTLFPDGRWIDYR